MNTCHTCMQCSLDGIFCHLHHRPTDPGSTCLQHSEGTDRHTQLRLIVQAQTTKRNIINNNQKWKTTIKRLS